MKQLSYGRISLSYGVDFDAKVPCRPTPLAQFSPIKMKTHWKTPVFSDRMTLELLKLTTPYPHSFRELYKEWFFADSWDKELGEGRGFLQWLKKNKLSINWRKTDLTLHPLFLITDAPDFESSDEMAKGHSFSLSPVNVQDRRVKLYLSDEAILSLLSLPAGEEEDFLLLVKNYVAMRFVWEKWKAPAPTFVEWLRAQAKRPVFLQGQIGLIHVTHLGY